MNLICHSLVEKTPRGKRWAARINRYHNDEDDNDDNVNDDDDGDDDDDDDDDPRTALNDNIGYVFFPLRYCLLSYVLCLRRISRVGFSIECPQLNLSHYLTRP